MKQLLILSGKGGTGKTTIAGAFIKLAEARAYADCDVDAPNLHLIMTHISKARQTDYYGMEKAVIDTELCDSCSICRQNCRFEAINESNGKYEVDSYACEGCGVCDAVCPIGAVFLQPAVAGELMLYKDNGVFSTARLKMGSGTSGKLVSEVKKQLKQEAADADLVIIDGSPGIGCPVIASLNGADMVLIVAEPSLSGISDMKRIIATAEKFRIKIGVCINKYDTNKELAQKIEAFCQERDLSIVGKIPFDTAAIKAINKGEVIVDIDCPAGWAATNVFYKTLKLMNS
ncbi:MULTISPECIES: ATP-binding protein [Dehalobacter]|jgi:MinD superfamily P-loop ATPase|uniref:ATPase n=2 Tax=Dehalobacter restrictus TaxID=55583 RepID=A0A857DDZ0_9FIRM|nr:MULTISPECIES: ATP-binding protein [Dehalobacter]AHF08938.1 ATPase [Dehalobacter restrictus DSM 9455]MCG1026051.1 ATP-binding protein [Dehalobacter sp.]MDJ0306669.1 ATP-binding protein [Dehalobacter sp.]OCZ50903.1 ATPase [Dehalobacter sp. TeCB1]QGZ99459.1 ATPase [Dehalobacter restrictus]